MLRRFFEIIKWQKQERETMIKRTSRFFQSFSTNSKAIQQLQVRRFDLDKHGRAFKSLFNNKNDAFKARKRN